MAVGYGDCVSCGFPILVTNNNPVSCPACYTLNQPNPISAAPLAAIGLPIALTIGALIISALGRRVAVKKAATYAAGYLAEPAIEAGAEWAKKAARGKLKKGK